VQYGKERIMRIRNWGPRLSLSLAIATALLAGMASPTPAQVVVLDNINTTGLDPNNAIAGTQAAIGFVAGTTMELQSVTVRVLRFGTVEAGVNLGLYTGNANDPPLMGSPLQIGATQALSSSTSEPRLLTFSPTSTFNLIAGQTYWLTLTAAYGNFAWYENGVQPPTTALGYTLVSGNPNRRLSASGWFTGTGGQNNKDFEFRLTATPEPSTWLMGGVVVACGGFAGWRRCCRLSLKNRHRS
jgi:hypothetical protein